MFDIVKFDFVMGEMIVLIFVCVYVGMQVELIKDYCIVGWVVDMLGWILLLQMVVVYVRWSVDDMCDFCCWVV